MKKCAKCKVEKDTLFFGKDNGRKDKLNPYCKECKNRKSADYYSSDKGKIKALEYRKANAIEATLKTKKWRENNQEKNKKMRRKYYFENKERLNKVSRKNYKDNRQKYIDQMKEYRKTERGRLVHANDTAKRRYLKQTTANGTIPIAVSRYPSSDALEELRVKQENKCCHCGCNLDYGGINQVHLDHLVPLSKGGTHTLENVAWSCSSCNLSKNNRLL